jgi:hypothetical protein
VRTGALLREHRGVYRVGHRAPSIEASYLAAVWACGEDALLSGRAAAYLFGVLKGNPPTPEVTTRTERRVTGVETRRERGLIAEDATSFCGERAWRFPRPTALRAAAGWTAAGPRSA